MELFHRKGLYLSSIVLLLAVACSPLRGYKFEKKQSATFKDVKPVFNGQHSILYKARINLFRKYYSGLIVIKETAPGTAHLAFITEVGMKIFDYEITAD